MHPWQRTRSALAPQLRLQVLALLAHCQGLQLCQARRGAQAGSNVLLAHCSNALFLLVRDFTVQEGVHARAEGSLRQVQVVAAAGPGRWPEEVWWRGKVKWEKQGAPHSTGWQGGAVAVAGSWQLAATAHTVAVDTHVAFSLPWLSRVTCS